MSNASNENVQAFGKAACQLWSMVGIQKGDFATTELTTGGGLLTDIRSKTFMETLIVEDNLLQEINVHPMSAPTEDMPEIGFLSRVMRPATEGRPVSAGDRSKPTTGKKTLTTQEIIGEVEIPYATVEDNVQQGSLMDLIFRLLSKRIAADVGELLVSGDTSSLDPYLALFNGMIKASTTNVVDEGVRKICRLQMKGAHKAIPKQFLRDKKGMRFYTSHDADSDWRDSLGDRATGLGDRYVTEDTPAPYMGTPVVPVNLFPDNLGSGTDETVVIFTHSENVILGVWRDVSIEWEKDIKSRVIRIVPTMRVGFRYGEELAVVKIVKVQTQ